MGKTGTKNPVTIATVAIAVLLVASAVGMGFRQLWREGVFSETQQLIADRQAVEPRTPAAGKEVSLESKVGDTDFQMWLEREMQPTAMEQDIPKITAEPRPDAQDAPAPVRQARSTADRQPLQIVKGEYKHISWDDWADIKTAYGKAKEAGSATFERIRISDNEDVYVGPEGDRWHVSTMPDGTTRKVQVRPDGSEGEVYISGGDKAK